MKKIIKSKSSFIISLFTLFIITSSCEKDLYENSIQNDTKEMNVRRISLKDIEKSISTKINGEINKVKNMKYETTTEGNRIEYNSELDIYIDTDNGNVVSADGKNFYTFPMFKDDDNKIENALFVDNGTGEMDTYLIKYNVTPEEYDNLTNEQIQNIDAEYQKIFWSGGEYVCFTWSTTTTVYPNCPHPNGMHSNGLQCEGQVTVSSATLCTWVEDFGSGNGGQTGGGDAGGVGGDTSGGGTTGGTSSGNTIHTGIGTSPELVKMKKFVKSLPDDLENWYNENESSHQTIQEYLEENNFSDESEEFIKNMINLELSNTPIIVGPNNPIENMIEYLECFDLTQGAQITIHADQPVANTNWAISSSGNVGHSFITIKQGINIMTFGFYPAVGTGFMGNVTGVMNNDQSHTYDVSLTMNIDATTLQNIILHSVESSVENYNLNNNNCTDFIIEISDILGLSIPDCYSSWGLGGGSNPGKFGQFIRTMTLPIGVTRNVLGGNAPANHKGC